MRRSNGSGWVQRMRCSAGNRIRPLNDHERTGRSINFVKEGGKMTQTTKLVMFLVLTFAMLLIVNPVAAQTPQQAAVKMGPDLPDELKAFGGPTGAWGKDRWDCARNKPRIGFMPELIFLEIQRDEALARYVIPESFSQWGVKASDRQVKGKFEKGADGKLSACKRIT